MWNGIETWLTIRKPETKSTGTQNQRMVIDLTLEGVMINSWESWTEWHQIGDDIFTFKSFPVAKIQVCFKSQMNDANTQMNRILDQYFANSGFKHSRLIKVEADTSELSTEHLPNKVRNLFYWLGIGRATQTNLPMKYLLM